MSSTFMAHAEPGDAVKVGLVRRDGGFYVFSIDLGYHTDVRVFLTPDQAEALERLREYRVNDPSTEYRVRREVSA